MSTTTHDSDELLNVHSRWLCLKKQTVREWKESGACLYLSAFLAESEQTFNYVYVQLLTKHIACLYSYKELMHVFLFLNTLNEREREREREKN